jgi:hypothetical protein
MKKSKAFKYFERNSQIPKKKNDIFVALLPKGISNLTSLFDELFNIFSFPGYFGFNWDALSDFLRDFHWLNEKTIVLVHEELPQLLNDDLWEYLDVLYCCVTDWSDDHDRELIVMFPDHCKDQISGMID